MPGNSIGQLFRITTFGESHGGAVGCVVDGCPSGIKITEAEIQKEMDRRKPGQSHVTTPRAETDEISILSGVYEGVTTGTPILLLAHNKDIRPEDYNELKKLYRPGHADYTYQQKYGVRDWRGSGRASARETLARVAAGAIAKKYLAKKNIEIFSYVQQVGNIKANIDYKSVDIEQIESNIVRCPDEETAKQMIRLIEEVKADNDSVGGIIFGVIKNCPVGLGEPVFDKLSADLGKAMLSINAVKGFEIGSGFSSVSMRGSQHNDEFYVDETGNIKTKTNYAGGVLGGISTGEDIYFRVAIKPVSTISKPQKTIDLDNEEVELEATGRHDPCVLPRAIPIVDAMSALVVMDHYLRHNI
ncbi:chorismate synthase [Candidatus Parcubacteria bacterium]|nr:chorismate synthase [Candidatus Parcubacteria bacterium]